MKDTITLPQIIETLSGHVYWKNLTGVVLGCNHEYAQDLGFKSSKDVVGKTEYELMPKERADIINDLDSQVMRDAVNKVTEEGFLTRNGKKYFFLSQKSPLKDDAGKIIGMINLSIDITAFKDTNELNIENKAAKRAMALVQQITDSMTHDLRTPFAGINIQADLMDLALTSDKSQKEKDKAYRNAIKNIKEAIKAYLGIINNLSSKIREFCLNKNQIANNTHKSVRDIFK